MRLINAGRSMKRDETEMAVLNRIKSHDVIRLCQELIRIPSHRQCEGHERRIAEYIAGELERTGVEVSLQRVVDDRVNVIARIPGDGNGYSLTLTGHLDTVPPNELQLEPFAATVSDDRIYGRGASDMKGALAAMISVMHAVSESNTSLKGDLIFAGVVGEETTSEGTARLIRNGPRTDFAINGEPTNMEVVIAHKGAVLVQITAKGKAAHCDTPWLGINSIEKMSRIVLAIADQIPRELKRKTHKYAGSPTINIGSIRGGDWPYTTVPDECKVIIITGLLPGEKRESVLPMYEKVIKGLQDRDREIQAKVDTVPIETIPEGYNLSFETSESAVIVKSVQKCAERILGTSPRLAGAQFWCDASILSYAGVETVIFGPGDIACAHSSVEYVPVDQLVNSARVYALTALDACLRDSS